MSNRLAKETSPYLLQHANNPVDWWPWGDEAFAEARAKDKPILLSIGYSTCHWCHVMEEESFEDPAIAELMNAHYVSIKVDREERPDVDAIYMAAVQISAGHGGWPMTVWLMPDGRPFFAATYLPPRDGARGVRTGFASLLTVMRGLYDQERDRVEQAAENLAAGVRDALAATGGAEGVIDGGPIAARALAYYRRRFDDVHGGMRGAPKFPSSLPLRWLLRQGELERVSKTLLHMAAGGIYDQLAGGFHRYSTDERWLVPHFEKMLYDNALLAIAYVEAYQASGTTRFLDVAKEILRYLARDMSAADGGFFAATDADSLTPSGKLEEGHCFTWTPGEIEAVLGPERARELCAVYGVDAAGHMEDGRSVLHVTPEIGRGELARHEEARAALLAARKLRPQPRLDDKRIASWNGLAIAAFARAAAVLGEPAYAERAAAAAQRLYDEQWVDGTLRRLPGPSRPGFLDDAANVCWGALELFAATLDPRWLEWAKALSASLRERFWDDAAGGYFSTPHAHERLLAREKPSYDGAEPSGNSIQCANLLRLHAWTGEDSYREDATRLLAANGRLLAEAPHALSEMLNALDAFMKEPIEIVVVAPDERSLRPFFEVLRRRLLPQACVVTGDEAQVARLHGHVPWTRDRSMRDGRATAHVCVGTHCLAPISDTQAFAEALQGLAAGKATL